MIIKTTITSIIIIINIIYNTTTNNKNFQIEASVLF